MFDFSRFDDPKGNEAKRQIGVALEFDLVKPSENEKNAIYDAIFNSGCTTDFQTIFTSKCEPLRKHLAKIANYILSGQLDALEAMKRGKPGKKTRPGPGPGPGGPGGPGSSTLNRDTRIEYEVDIETASKLLSKIEEYLDENEEALAGDTIPVEPSKLVIARAEAAIDNPTDTDLEDLKITIATLTETLSFYKQFVVNNTLTKQRAELVEATERRNAAEKEYNDAVTAQNTLKLQTGPPATADAKTAAARRVEEANRATVKARAAVDSATEAVKTSKPIAEGFTKAYADAQTNKKTVTEGVDAKRKAAAAAAAIAAAAAPKATPKAAAAAAAAAERARIDAEAREKAEAAAAAAAATKKAAASAAAAAATKEAAAKKVEATTKAEAARAAVEAAANAAKAAADACAALTDIVTKALDAKSDSETTFLNEYIDVLTGTDLKIISDRRYTLDSVESRKGEIEENKNTLSSEELKTSYTKIIAALSAIRALNGVKATSRKATALDCNKIGETYTTLQAAIATRDKALANAIAIIADFKTQKAEKIVTDAQNDKLLNPWGNTPAIIAGKASRKQAVNDAWLKRSLAKWVAAKADKGTISNFEAFHAYDVATLRKQLEKLKADGIQKLQAIEEKKKKEEADEAIMAALLEEAFEDVLNEEIETNRAAAVAASAAAAAVKATSEKSTNAASEAAIANEAAAAAASEAAIAEAARVAEEAKATRAKEESDRAAKAAESAKLEHDKAIKAAEEKAAEEKRIAEAKRIAEEAARTAAEEAARTASTTEADSTAPYIVTIRIPLVSLQKYKDLAT